MKVYWTDNAADHLVNICEYIALNSPTYAKQMVERKWWSYAGSNRSSAQISDQPFSGRKVPEYLAEDVRELIETPYRIIDCVKRDQIDVLAVIHGAQLMPGKL